MSGPEVIKAFIKAGIEADHIFSVQYHGSNWLWCILFTNQHTKNFVLEKGLIHFGNVPVFRGDADYQTVIVNVYEAPPKMPDTVVIGWLAHYGHILSFR